MAIAARQDAWEAAKLGAWPHLTYEEFEKFYDAEKGIFLPPDTFVAIQEATPGDLKAWLEEELAIQELNDVQNRCRQEEEVLDCLHSLKDDPAKLRQTMEEHAAEIATRLAARGRHGRVFVNKELGGELTTFYSKAGSSRLHDGHEAKVLNTTDGETYMEAVYLRTGEGGVGKTWHPNGKVRTLYYMDKDHKSHGTSRSWFASGSVGSETTWHHGQQMGQMLRYEEFTRPSYTHYLVMASWWRDGKGNGLWTNYSADGIVEAQGRYHEGRKEGPWKYVGEKGGVRVEWRISTR